MALISSFSSDGVADTSRGFPDSTQPLQPNLSSDRSSSVNEPIYESVKKPRPTVLSLSQSMAQLALALTAYPTSYQTLFESLKIVAQTVGAEYAMLFQVDPKTGVLQALRPVFTSLPDALQAQAELEAVRHYPDANAISMYSFKQEKALYANAGDEWMGVLAQRYTQAHLFNALALPLQVEGRVQGVCCILNKQPGDFDEFDVQNLSEFLPLLGSLLKNLQLIHRLEQQERLNGAVVDAAVDGFIEVNPDMHITRFSKGAENLTGWTAEEVLGHTCHEILMPHSPENELLCNNCPLRRSFRSDIAITNVETLIRSRDGEDSWASCSYNSVRDERGQITSGLIAIKDIYRLKALSDELRQQSQQQESLIGVNNAINGLSNIQEIYQVSLDAISRSIDFDLGTIHSLDPATNDLTLIAFLEKEVSRTALVVAGLSSEDELDGQGVTLENEELQRQARLRQYRATHNTDYRVGDSQRLNLELKLHQAHECEALRQNEPYMAMNLPGQAVCEVISDFDGLQSHLCVPIKTNERNYGVLHLGSRRPYAFWGSDFVLALSICKQIAVGAERARLFEQVDRLARTDPLTGLYNKRELWERLDREVRRAERRNSPLSLMMIDLDRLKWINDCFGHNQGDVLLTRLSDLIQSQCRASDVAFRYGGDELCVVLPDTSQAEAKIAADRLRNAAREIRFDYDDDQVMIGDETLVTMSIGIASYPTDATNPLQLFESADTAMYRAKETGKDRAVIFDRQTDHKRRYNLRRISPHDPDDRLTPPHRADTNLLSSKG